MFRIAAGDAFSPGIAHDAKKPQSLHVSRVCRDDFYVVLLPRIEGRFLAGIAIFRGQPINATMADIHLAGSSAEGKQMSH